MVAAHGGEGSPEIGGPTFDKWYREWRAGRVQDEAILNVYGEWLFFYKVSRDGIEGDTLAESSHLKIEMCGQPGNWRDQGVQGKRR